MKKTLVAYFSASGVTEKLAINLATAVAGNHFKIIPEQPYTTADLDWMNKKSRSSIEMSDMTFRPAVANKVENIGQYDVIYIGFPIWWYVAPTIINTFLEQYNLEGKTVIPFATSGMSGMGKTNAMLKNSCKGANLREGKRFEAHTSVAELKKWADGSF